jgi:hypothetical protein
MTRVTGEWSAGVREMLAQERQIPAVPAATRARALARALEAVATLAVTPPIEPTAPAGLRWAAVLAVLGLGSTAGGAAAYRLSAHLRAVPTPAAVAPRMPESTIDAKTIDGKTTETAIAEPRAEGSTSSSPCQQGGRPADGEVRLLEQAWVALERQDFAAALVPLVDHARRFSNGRLTEEREALRVKALAGLGLRDEVRRAAADFEARFPRSPLLAAINRLASSS